MAWHVGGRTFQNEVSVAPLIIDTRPKMQETLAESEALVEKHFLACKILFSNT